jgi:putative transposase
MTPRKDGSIFVIDLGLKSFAALFIGEAINNPTFLRVEEKALAKAHRKLSKAQ